MPFVWYDNITVYRPAPKKKPVLPVIIIGGLILWAVAQDDKKHNAGPPLSAPQSSYEEPQSTFTSDPPLLNTPFEPPTTAIKLEPLRPKAKPKLWLKNTP